MVTLPAVAVGKLRVAVGMLRVAVGKLPVAVGKLLVAGSFHIQDILHNTC